MVFFPQTPSHTNLSFVEAPDSLSVHSYLHTLLVFVGKRSLAHMRMSRYLRPLLRIRYF